MFHWFKAWRPMMIVRRPFLVVFAFLVVSPAVAQNQADTSSVHPPCTENPVHRQFDFWVGEWTVYNAKGAQVGTNVIENMVGGCMLFENWTSARGGTGKSMNYWDPVDEKWKQVWSDSRGNIAYFEGGRSGDAMVLNGEWITSDGTSSLLRGTWTPLEDGRVRQHFEQSLDYGITWTTWFDGYYTRE